MTIEPKKAFTLDDAIQFVYDIQRKYSTGKYIFRGTNRVYSETGDKYVYKHKADDTINSSLYRSTVYSKGTDKQGIVPDYSNFIVNAEEEVIEENRHRYPSSTDRITILTDIRHFGDETNFIDFTRDISIALFLACDGNGEQDKDGELLLLNTEEVQKISLLDYDKDTKGYSEKTKEQLSELNMIDPPVTYHSGDRVKHQKSVFVYPKLGYISRARLNIEPIYSNLKKVLLEYLKLYFNITYQTIYNDTVGWYIENEKLKGGSKIINSKDDTDPDNNGGSGRQKDSSITKNDHDEESKEKLEFAETYFYRGSARQEQGDMTGAIEDYDKALELNPKLAEVYNNRGNARQELEKFDEAIKDYDEALKLNPKLAEVYNNRGNARQELKKFSEAIKDYDEALELNPRYANAYNNRGNARQELEKFDEAIKDYDEALKLNPKLAEVYNNRGSARQELKKFSEAIKDYDEALELNPRYANAYNNRGNARQKQGDMAGAIEDYDKALKLDPKLVKIYGSRGNAKQKQGDITGAIEDYNETLKFNPEYAEVYSNRGGAKQIQGDIMGAIKDYNKALELNPDLVKAYAGMILAYIQLNDITKAEKYYKALLPLDTALAEEMRKVIDKAKSTP